MGLIFLGSLCNIESGVNTIQSVNQAMDSMSCFDFERFKGGEYAKNFECEE